jgi:transcriptional regulator with XRE-family HTH domain
MSTSLQERIKKLRESIGLSRNLMSDKTGIPAQTFASIELRGRSPSGETLQKIAESMPEFACWLLTEEDAPLAGQYSPLELHKENQAYQIIDVIDARDLDQTIVKPTSIEKAIFLITGNVPISPKVKRLATSYLHSSNIGYWSDKPFTDGINTNFGTAILLVLKTRRANTEKFKRAILVQDGSFDLLDIERKDCIYGLLKELKAWFETHSIRRFEVKSVNRLTLNVIESGLVELKTVDIHDAPESAKKSFELWCESF